MGINSAAASLCEYRDMYETLCIEQEGSIARLWLNRPDKLNPLSLLTLNELVRAAEELNAIEGLRVVIVGGRGRSFSAGADLSGFPSADTPGAREAADAGRRMADALEGLRAISIARIQG